MKEFEMRDLSEFDGKDGRPSYVVHRGMVYDVSGSRLWKGGLHMKRHHAGTDLSADIGGAPHGTEMLERVPQVGTIGKEKTAGAEGSPSVLLRLIERIPMFRRHPHPMTVHFPIVFMLAAAAFNCIYLATGLKTFENTAFHCLTGGLLFTPLVMVTGLLSWQINYLARPVKPVTIKLSASLALFMMSLLAFTWRAADPGIMDSFDMSSAVYFLVVLSLAPLVVVIGWFGARLTFPIEKE